MRQLGLCTRLTVLSVLLALAPLGMLLAAAESDETQTRDLSATVDAIRQSSDWSTADESLVQLLEREERSIGEPQDAILTLENLASRATEMGLPLEAIDLYERALELRGGIDRAETLEAAEAMERLAATLQPLDRLDRAEELLRRALEIRENEQGSDGAKVQSLLSRLSKLIREARPEDEEAEQLILRRLELTDSYSLRRQVAKFYSAKGDSEQALEHYREAVDRAESHDRNRVYWLAPALANLAREHKTSGDPELAETYLIQALQAAEAQYGTRHPYLAWALRNLGEFYVEQQRFVEAESYLDRALEMKQLAYGPCGACSRNVTDLLLVVHDALGLESDPCYAEPHSPAPQDPPAEGSVEARLASLDEQTAELIQRRELARAKEAAQQTLELREQAFGIDSLETAESLKALARIARELKRTDEELAVLDRYLVVLEQNLPARAPAIAAALSSMGRVARREKDNSLAQEYYTRETYARESTGQNLALARTLKTLGEISHDLGDERRAGEFYLRAADLWELMASRHAADYVKNRVALAKSYVSLGLADQAELVLLELLSYEERRDPARPDLLLAVLEPLEIVYAETERQPEADAVRLRTAALRKELRSRR